MSKQTLVKPEASNLNLVLKVGAQTKPPSLAGAIFGVIKDQNYVDVQAMGAGAVNQLVKAVAIARGNFAAQNKDLVMAPEFRDIEIDDQVKTIIRVRVYLLDKELLV